MSDIPAGVILIINQNIDELLKSLGVLRSHIPPREQNISEYTATSISNEITRCFRCTDGVKAAVNSIVMLNNLEEDTNGSSDSGSN